MTASISTIAIVNSSPVVLLLNDGSAVLLVANDAKRNVVWLRQSRLDPNDPPLAVGREALAAVCRGEAILIRTERAASRNEAAFNLGGVAGLVRMDSGAMRDVGLASIALSLLTVLPPLTVKLFGRASEKPWITLAPCRPTISPVPLMPSSSVKLSFRA